MNARVLFAVSVLTFVLPAVAGAQAAGPRVSVQGAFGSPINAGGSSQAVSLGFSPGEHLELLVSAERIHVPTEVNRYENGWSASRGGTTTFVSGEVRFFPVTFGRVTPYVLAGLGRGRSHLNQNDIFPNAVTRDAGLLFTGGGARVALTGHLSAFADVRCLLQVENSEAGGYLFLPVRGGLAWRF